MRRLVLVAVSVAALAVVPAAAAHVFAVRGDVKIGAYPVRADGSLAGALRAFGEPTTRRHTFGRATCTATWRQHGLTINFYNLGGRDACDPEYGRFSRAFLRGNHWMTTKRLRVGDPLSKLRRLYPSARLRPGKRYYWPSGYWLVVRSSIYGNGGSYPALLAEVERGRVVGSRCASPPAATEVRNGLRAPTKYPPTILAQTRCSCEGRSARRSF